MTVAERRNAAIFIQNSTVRPFIFMGSSFKCFFCPKYFSDTADLLEHTSSHKPEDIEEILTKYVPKGKRTLQVDISSLKCRLCDTNLYRLDDIRGHLTSEHSVVFSQASNGMTGFNLKITDGLFSCHICGKKFHNFSLLNSHMNTHFGKVVCESCGACFPNQLLLLAHKEQHLRQFACKNCEKVFSKKSQLKYHNDITHKGKNRVKMKKCPHCDEIFKEHYTKMVHLKKVHGISKTFQCYVCQKNFTTRRNLTEHITRLHTEKFKCGLCEKCFGMESKLKMHMRSHTGERSYICNVCKNAYMHRATLTRHMRTHEVNNHKCVDCGTDINSKKSS